MSEPVPTEYLNPDEYAEAAKALDGMCGMILFEFARKVRSDRDIIIRNFVARSATLVKAIFRLWDIQDYQDCWILHRCLLDRLFHLWHLRENNAFEQFEAWSFLRQYEARNRVLSDPEFSHKAQGPEFSITADRKERALKLSKNPPVWHKPRPKEVAKRLDMPFLYSYGYDYASRHVHPMANDGIQDFFTITKLKPAPEFPDQRVVLSNTLLIQTMVVQQALNASTLAWRVIVFDFLDELRRFLGNKALDYRLTFLKLARMFENQIPLAGVLSGGAVDKSAV